jgi:hypothetical protein
MTRPKTATARLSSRRRRANRRNARGSTGPRSRRGKRRVRGNALKHGLAAGGLAQKITAPQLAALVAGLVGEGADPAQQQAAVTFAMAHLYWQRVQAVQRKLLNRKLRALQLPPHQRDSAVSYLLTGDPELRILARYERRASNQRLRAARALAALSTL